ncbi:MAG: N-dimethylarginine dimethylaminohydrolase [Parasphingorhabdus sp.]|jgi:N-dimethylarginine dimethylaminohydrolase
MGYHFDYQKAQLQHQSMVDVYEPNGVRCQFVEANEGLLSSVLTSDSSFMTPWGAVVTNIQTPPRRQDYSVVSEFYHKAGIPIWRWGLPIILNDGDFVIVKLGW